MTPGSRSSPTGDALGRRCGSRRAYLQRGEGEARDPQAFVPESSRRARGFAVYAALRSLGGRVSPSSSPAAAAGPS